jgi:uncharacterized protein
MLSQKDIQKIIDTIVEGYKPDKIILFGSYAGGTPNGDSDLDIAIIKKTEELPRKRNQKVRLLFKPYPCPMDIFVYTPTEFNHKKNSLGTLAYIVNREGKVVYGN